MKKVSLVTLALAVSLSLAACGSSKTAATEAASTAAETVTEAAESLKEETESSEAEIESSEPVTEESSKEEVKAALSTSVSESLFDNQFALDDVVFTMPIAVSELEPFGLSVPAEKSEYMLNTKTMTSGRVESTDGSRLIFVGFYNLGTEVIKMSESKLDSVNLKKKHLEGFSVAFAKGITFGATMDEVKAAYGEPTNFVDGDPAAKVMRERMVYKNGDSIGNFYEFAFEDQVLVGVELYVEEK